MGAANKLGSSVLKYNQKLLKNGNIDYMAKAKRQGADLAPFDEAAWQQSRMADARGADTSYPKPDPNMPPPVPREAVEKARGEEMMRKASKQYGDIQRRKLRLADL